MTPHELPTERQCTGCSEWKPLSEFPRNPRIHLGVSSRCRNCHRAATKDWQDRNRERVNAERRAEYRAEHPLPKRPCAVCGRTMQKRPDALVCGERCRNRRKREQRRRALGPTSRSRLERGPWSFWAAGAIIRSVPQGGTRARSRSSGRTWPGWASRPRRATAGVPST
jgi:hypothetical protein